MAKPATKSTATKLPKLGEPAAQRGGGSQRRGLLGGLSGVGHILMNQQPGFDSRMYGYPRLSNLVAVTGLFDVDRWSVGEGEGGADSHPGYAV